MEKQRENTSKVHPGSTKSQGQGGKGAQGFWQTEQYMQKHANEKEQGTLEKLEKKKKKILYVGGDRVLGAGGLR